MHVPDPHHTVKCAQAHTHNLPSPVPHPPPSLLCFNSSCIKSPLCHAVCTLLFFSSKRSLLSQLCTVFKYSNLTRRLFLCWGTPTIIKQQWQSPFHASISISTLFRQNLIISTFLLACCQNGLVCHILRRKSPKSSSENWRSKAQIGCYFSKLECGCLFFVFTYSRISPINERCSDFRRLRQHLKAVFGNTWFLPGFYMVEAPWQNRGQVGSGCLFLGCFGARWLLSCFFARMSSKLLTGIWTIHKKSWPRSAGRTFRAL